ncbi:MAG: hypothetical protein U0802_12340 [Candidatus Binatia bacterium]
MRRRQRRRRRRHDLLHHHRLRQRGRHRQRAVRRRQYHQQRLLRGGVRAPGAGSACDDGDLCTNGDACDGGNVLGAAARDRCAQAPSGRARLLLRATGGGALTWKMSAVGATSAGDLGDPTGDLLALCLYDDAAAPQPRLAAAAPAENSLGANGAGVVYRGASGMRLVKVRAR